MVKLTNLTKMEFSPSQALAINVQRSIIDPIESLCSDASSRKAYSHQLSVQILYLASTWHRRGRNLACGVVIQRHILLNFRKPGTVHVCPWNSWSSWSMCYLPFYFTDLLASQETGRSLAKSVIFLYISFPVRETQKA